jgi:hypothetical protein
MQIFCLLQQKRQKNRIVKISIKKSQNVYVVDLATLYSQTHMYR